MKILIAAFCLFTITCKAQPRITESRLDTIPATFLLTHGHDSPMGVAQARTGFIVQQTLKVECFVSDTMGSSTRQEILFYLSKEKKPFPPTTIIWQYKVTDQPLKEP